MPGSSMQYTLIVVETGHENSLFILRLSGVKLGFGGKSAVNNRHQQCVIIYFPGTCTVRVL